MSSLSLWKHRSSFFPSDTDTYDLSIEWYHHELVIISCLCWKLIYSDWKSEWDVIKWHSVKICIKKSHDPKRLHKYKKHRISLWSLNNLRPSTTKRRRKKRVTQELNSTGKERWKLCYKKVERKPSIGSVSDICIFSWIVTDIQCQLCRSDFIFQTFLGGLQMDRHI